MASGEGWAAGDYRAVAMTMLPVSAHLVRAAGVRPGDRVLDVGCGTGVTAITARRAGAVVTGLDLTPRLLELAREDAALAGFPDIRWDEADAEKMPYADASFDVVLSSFGHMHAPHPEAVTREMLRVLRHGGRVAFATWPPEHFQGAVGEAIARHVPGPPPDEPRASPYDWGRPDVVRARLGAAVRALRFERGALLKPALSLEHYWESTAASAPGLVNVIRALGEDAERLAALRRDFIDACRPFYSENVIRQDYLISAATKA